MRNINSNGKKCYILDEYLADDIVQYEAAEYWYLDLYIIVLNDIDGVFSSSKQKYMVLEYPSYTEVESDFKINDCIWSVPYMAYLFHKKGTKRYNTVKSIMSFYKEQISRHNNLFDELENYRFYHMGISNYEKVDGNQYIEYKISSRQPDKWKCYYIQEHYITGIDSLGLLNLADPEGLHCYRYYPLSPQPIIRGDIVNFAGKHLASNVVHLLKASYNKLMQYSNPISEDILRYQLYGIVFRIDVVGFTAIYNKIVDEMKSLDETGKEIAVHFIAGLSSIFENRMQEFGICQFIIEGDGVTGTFPLKGSADDVFGVKRIIDCIYKIQEDINILAMKMKEKICLRCSITVGEYIYGKVAGLCSTKQAVGEIMITLSRMDQFLQEVIKEKSDLSCKSIMLCIKNQLYDECSDYLKNNYFQKMMEQTEYRETTIDSTVLYKEV